MTIAQIGKQMLELSKDQYDMVAIHKLNDQLYAVLWDNYNDQQINVDIQADMPINETTAQILLDLIKD